MMTAFWLGLCASTAIRQGLCASYSLCMRTQLLCPCWPRGNHPPDRPSTPQFRCADSLGVQEPAQAVGRGCAGGGRHGGAPRARRRARQRRGQPGRRPAHELRRLPRPHQRRAGAPSASLGDRGVLGLAVLPAAPARCAPPLGTDVIVHSTLSHKLGCTDPRVAHVFCTQAATPSLSCCYQAAHVGMQAFFARKQLASFLRSGGLLRSGEEPSEAFPEARSILALCHAVCHVCGMAVTCP